MAIEEDLGDRLDNVDLDALPTYKRGRRQIRLQSDLIAIGNDRSRQPVRIGGAQKNPF